MITYVRNRVSTCKGRVYVQQDELANKIVRLLALFFSFLITLDLSFLWSNFDYTLKEEEKRRTRKRRRKKLQKNDEKNQKKGNKKKKGKKIGRNNRKKNKEGKNVTEEEEMK